MPNRIPEGYEAEIAKITSAYFGYEDHGILTCQLRLDFGGGGQATPGYGLDEWDEEKRKRYGVSLGTGFVMALMGACGVSKWEQVVGRTVYALRKPGGVQIAGLAPLPTEPGAAVVFEELAQEYKAREVQWRELQDRRAEIRRYVERAYKNEGLSFDSLRRIGDLVGADLGALTHSSKSS